MLLLQITPPSFGMERGPSMERPMGHTAMGHPGMMGGPRHMYQQNYGQRYPMQYMDYSKQNQYNRLIQRSSYRRPKPSTRAEQQSLFNHNIDFVQEFHPTPNLRPQACGAPTSS